MTIRGGQKILVFAFALFTAFSLLGIGQPPLFSSTGKQDDVPIPIEPTDSLPLENKATESATKSVETQDLIISAQTPPLIYTVQPGDTLFSISLKYYGSEKYWEVIYNANPQLIRNKTELKPGLTLTIPELPPSVLYPTIPAPSIPAPSIPPPNIPSLSIPAPSVPSSNRPSLSIPAPSIPSPSIQPRSIPAPNIPRSNIPSSNIPPSNIPPSSIPSN